MCVGVDGHRLDQRRFRTLSRPVSPDRRPPVDSQDEGLSYKPLVEAIDRRRDVQSRHFRGLPGGVVLWRPQGETGAQRCELPRRSESRQPLSFVGR